jgi:phage-related minor tail protein
MAGNRIKGITIEIGGDTVGLQNALKDVNKRSSELQSELKQVERALKFNPGNIELLAQKQQILTEQILNTTEKLNSLKEAQTQVQAQFERGELGIEQYRAFQREVIHTENRLNGLQQSLREMNNGSSVNDTRHDLQNLSSDAEDAQGSIKDLGGELTGLVGGLAAGGGIAGVIDKALDASSLKTKINISFDVPEKSKESVRQAIKGIEAYGVDGEAALEGVRRQWTLNKNASDQTNAAIVKGAATIAASYAGVDFTELVQETNEISKAFKISNEDALALTNSLLKTGFPPEQLDTISEYGTQLQRAGYDAKEIQAIMAAGVDTKTWNIDNLLDGLKEGRIKMAEFGQGVPKAMDELLAKTGISKTQLEQWGQAVAKGGEGGSKAMVDVATALNGVKDQTLKNQLGVQLFGTIYEDQGQNIIDTLLNAKNKTVDLKANQDQLNESAKQLDSDPAVEFHQALTDIQTASAPLLTIISDIISDVSGWASQNPTLVASISAIITVIGILVGLCMALAPLFVTLTGVASVLGISMTAVTWPVLAVVAAIAAVIAIGVALYKNWDTIKEKAGTLIDKLGPFKPFLLGLLGPFGLVVGAGVALYKNWDKIKEKAGELRDKVVNLFKGIHWDLPNIKLPHFSLKGKFDLMPPDISVPKISVNWYKDGGLFPANSPRLVGMGDASVPEAALPLSDKVLGTIANMISDRMNFNGQSIIIQPAPVIFDGREVARVTFQHTTEFQNQSKRLYNRNKGR